MSLGNKTWLSALTAVVIAGLGSCEQGVKPEVDERSERGVFEDLGERPLRVPTSPPDKPCELERNAAHIRGVPAEAALGDGPVMSVFPSIPRGLDLFPPSDDSVLAESRWRGAEVLLISEPRYEGPLLVRGRQIDGSRRVGFGDDEQPQWELRLPAGKWETVQGLRWGDRMLNAASTASSPPAHCPRCLTLSRSWRVQRVVLRIAGDGCYAMQLDGEGFSDVIEFGAIWQPGR